jgi:hypothetical protein
MNALMMTNVEDRCNTGQISCRTQKLVQLIFWALFYSMDSKLNESAIAWVIQITNYPLTSRLTYSHENDINKTLFINILGICNI